MDVQSPGIQPSRRWFTHPDVIASLVLVVAWVLFFSDLLFSSKNFYFRDILNFHYPLRKALIQAYGRGEFPLWNPFIYLGQPMLANPNYMAFYPTNLLHLLVSFNYAFKLHFIVHPLLGGLGIYFLQRRLGIGALSAFGGSLVYEFSGTVLSFLNLYNIVPAVALMPWLAWGFVGALEGKWARRAVVFGGVLGLQVIAFEPLMFQCEVWLLGGLAVYHWLESKERVKAAGRVLKVGAVGALYAVSLAAVQVIPTLELLPRSARVAGYDFNTVSGWSMHPIDLISVVIPNLFGNPYTINNANYWGESFHAAREPYLVSFFLGAATILLVCLSILSRRRNLKLVLASLTLVSIILALGRFNPFYRWFYDHVPVFRLARYPSKYFLFGTLALAILAALGLEVVLTQGKEGSRRLRQIVAAALLGLALSLAFWGTIAYWKSKPQYLAELIRSTSDPSAARVKDLSGIQSNVLASIRSSGIFLLLCSSVILVSPFWKRPTLIGILLSFILAAELTPANLRLSPLISEADVDFVSDVNLYLKKNGPCEPYRVAPPTLLRPMPDLQIRLPNRSSAWLTLFYRMSGQPMYGIMDEIQYSVDRSVDHLNTRESNELWVALGLVPEAVALTALEKMNSPIILMLEEIRDPRVRLLSSFDTRGDMKLKVYWLESTLSRGYFTSGVELAGSHRAAMEKFLRPEFPFGDTVILEDHRTVEKMGQPGAGVVKIRDYRALRVLCEVEAKVAGYLVLLDSFYPGWRAYVDGRQVEILQANYAFRAVEVQAGKHEVEFRYRPWTFYFGLVVSCLALILGLVALTRGRVLSSSIPAC